MPDDEETHVYTNDDTGFSVCHRYDITGVFNRYYKLCDDAGDFVRFFDDRGDAIAALKKDKTQGAALAKCR